MRKSWRQLAGGVVLAGLAAAIAAPAGAQGPKTLRMVPEADLRILDPVWTSAYITRNFGYMIYDTLFAFDSDFKPQPQMVGSWTESDDHLKWSFTLRDGLKWHDGTPVRAIDCTTSIERYNKRDTLGQALAEAIGEMKAVDDKTFTITLRKPFPLLLNTFAKISSSANFMMPERVAKTDAFTQINETIGSGPFKFVKEEWLPGSKAVFVKNTDYVPRSEKPSWGSGGKVVKVDRVEWVYIPDPTTAANALIAGEVDWWQLTPADLAPVLQKNKDITVTTVDPLGIMGIFRFNHLLPPFNDQRMRQAVLMVADQKDYMAAVAADPKNWKTCYSFFPCGTPMSNDAKSDALGGKRDFDKAKQLIKDAGYKGEKIVVMAAPDQPIVYAQGLVTADLLKRLGMNVDFQVMDWGTLITRRASKEPIDKGGWNIFFTYTIAPDLLDPAVLSALRGNGDKAWFGWPTDNKIEALRAQWLEADFAGQKKLAAEVQEQAFTSVPYIPTGQFTTPTSFRKNIEGVIIAPVTFMWNVEKK